MTIKITKEEARKYMLSKQGLYGDYIFEGKEGVSKYIEQTGCIQFDPIDICGKNHELVLQSRVKGFRKEMLNKLLYTDRKLFDYLDKNMSIISTKDWPYFERTRESYKGRANGRDDINGASAEILDIINKKGPVCSQDLDYNEKVNWSWAPTRLSRAVLESLYFHGELIVHHKNNTKKYYDLTTKHIPNNILNSKDPNMTDEQYYKWYVQRRIGSVGLLWNKSGDAWLGISGLKSKERTEAFNSLLNEGKIIELSIEDMSDFLYINVEDKKYLNDIKSEQNNSIRTELIAPLDNLMWDRRLIKELFDFDYKWEIYTPVEKRKYGYYVLPILHNDRFIARIEIIKDKSSNALVVKNLWWENSSEVNKNSKKNIEECLSRFAG